MVALLVAFCCCQAESVTLNPPEEADPKVVAEAAKILEKRIEAYGYKEVAVTVAEGKIRVSCGTGVTEEMRQRISVIARWQAQSVEFAVIRLLSATEKEQYVEGKTAPAGTRWIRSVEEDGRAFPWVLVSEPAIIVVKGPVKPESVKIPKKWAAVIKESRWRGGGVVPVIDGVTPAATWWAGKMMTSPDRWRDYYVTNKDGSCTWFPNSILLEAILANPLPIRLSMVTPKKK